MPATMISVSAIHSVATAATVGSTLSRMPSHMRRGSVYTARWAMNKVTTISSHETMNANTAAVNRPVLMFGTMTRNTVVSGAAPRLREACSKRGSSMLNAVDTAMTTNGNAKMVCAITTPSQVS